MVSFGANAYGYCLEDLELEWIWVIKNQDKSFGKVELWEIEPDKRNPRNRYVIITRYRKEHAGREPKIKFVRKIREAEGFG